VGDWRTLNEVCSGVLVFLSHVRTSNGGKSGGWSIRKEAGVSRNNLDIIIPSSYSEKHTINQLRGFKSSCEGVLDEIANIGGDILAGRAAVEAEVFTMGGSLETAFFSRFP
jgi:hypothetical protein